MKINTTAFVLAVPDADSAATWWTDVVGLERLLDIPGWVFVGKDTCQIRLGSCPDSLPPSELGDHSYFGYLEIDDVGALRRRLEEKGAEILFEPRDEPWGVREMGVRTPDGHRFMFAQRISA